MSAQTKPAKPVPLGRNGFKYRPRFGLIVICKDEAHQQAMFQQLRGQGLKPKVVSV